MAKSKFSITALIGVDSSKMKRGLARAAGRMKSWAKNTMASVARVVAMGVAAAVAALAAFGVKSVKEFTSFEQGMLEVFTLLPGIAGGAMDQMSDDVLKLADKMGVLPEEIVPALYQALSAGVPPGNVFDFLESAIKGAQAGVATTAESVATLTSVVNAYGKANISAAEASDIIFQTIKGGVTTYGELAAALYNVVPAAAQAGVGFKDVSSAIAAMTAQGVPTKVATTQIRQAILALTAPNETLVKGLGSIGVSTEQLANIMKEPGGLLKALELIKKAAKGNATDFKMMMGSVEGLQAAFVLTANGGAKFTEMMESMGDAAGATDAAYVVMTSGLKHQFNKLLTSLKVVMIGMGKSLAPFVKAAIPAVTKVIKMIAAIPWTKILQGFARVWIYGIKPYFVALGKALKRLPWHLLIEYLLPIAKLVVFSIQKIVKVLINMAPVIIPFIQMLAGFFVFLYGKFFMLIKYLAKVAPDLSKIFRQVFQVLAAVFNFFLDPSMEKFKLLVQFIKERFGWLGKFLKDFGKNIYKILVNQFMVLFEALEKEWGSLLEWYIYKLKEFLNNIPGFADAAAKFMEVWDSVKEQLGPVIEEMIAAFKKMFATMTSGQASTDGVSKMIKFLKDELSDGIVTIVKLSTNLLKLFVMVTKLAAQILTKLAPALGELLPVAMKIVGAALFIMVSGFKVFLKLCSILGATLVKLGPVFTWLAEQAGPFFKSAVGATKLTVDWITKLYHWLTDRLGRALKTLSANVQIVFAFIKARIKQFTTAWSKAWDIVGPVVKAAFDFVQARIKKFIEIWSKAFDFMKHVARSAMNPVLTIFDFLKKKVYDVLFGGTITKDFAKAFKFISDVVLGTIKAIISAFTSMGDVVKGIFGGVFKLGEKALKLAGSIMKGAGSALGGIVSKLGGGGGGRGARVQTRSGAITGSSLQTALQPIVEKLTSMDTSLKSIDQSLKGKFVNQ